MDTNFDLDYSTWTTQLSKERQRNQLIGTRSSLNTMWVKEILQIKNKDVKIRKDLIENLLIIECFGLYIKHNIIWKICYNTKFQLPHISKIQLLIYLICFEYWNDQIIEHLVFEFRKRSASRFPFIKAVFLYSPSYDDLLIYY